MKEEIINRVANSKLITIDLEDFYPNEERVSIDISQWLFEGLILREKEFRQVIHSYDWQQYSGQYVALHCSSDAIIPGWAYLLISSALQPFAKKTIVGTLEVLEILLYQDIIANFDPAPFKDKSIIIKGCATKPIPENAYVLLLQKLQPIARSLMYGEACSSVPLYKASK